MEEGWRELKKRSKHMRDEMVKEIEEIDKEIFVSEGIKDYAYTYPGTKITLDLRFSDSRLESIYFYSPEFRTQEGVTLENYLYKENTRYVIGLKTMSNGSLYASYFLPGLSFHATGRLLGLVSISPFCSRK
jgi:hypothetical protein